MTTILNITATGDWQDIDVPDNINLVSIAIQCRTPGEDMYLRISGETTYWTIRAGTMCSMNEDIKFNRAVTLINTDFQIKATVSSIVEVFLSR